MLTGLIIVIVLFIIISLVILFWDSFKLLKEKKSFKKIVGNKLYQISLDNDFYLINQVALAIDTKIIHFDHILFTNKFIYCIGTKFCDGPLSGRFDDSKWFKYGKNNTIDHIKNPMQLPKIRVEYLRSQLRANEDLFISVVLVNDSCILDDIQNCPKNNFIMNLGEFKSFVNKNEKMDIPQIDAVQLDTLVKNIYRSSVKTLEGAMYNGKNNS